MRKAFCFLPDERNAERLYGRAQPRLLLDYFLREMSAIVCCA